MGDVPWGTHVCQFYRTQEDLIEILLPYFKTGLADNELCIWITSGPLDVDEAKKSLRKAVADLDDYVQKGQIEILDSGQWYTRSGQFQADHVLSEWIEKEHQSREMGFDGLRVVGDTSWLKEKDRSDFTDYELSLSNFIKQLRTLAICTYSLDKCGVFEIIDALKSHQFSLIKRNGKWEYVENYRLKKAFAALRESEERFRISVENLLDCFGVYSAVRDDSGSIVDFRIEYLNKAACVNYRMTKEELIGKYLCELLPAHRETGLFDKYCQVVETGKPLKEESLRYEDVYNNRRFSRAFDIKVTKLGDGFAAAWRDVTDRKHAEQVIKRAEDQIKKALREKDIFLKEIHHRVKNNLQFISSLFQLQAERVHDPKAQDVFRESEIRIHAMASIHDELYKSRGVTSIRISHYLESLMERLLLIYEREAVPITVNKRTEDVSLDIDLAIPCGLIFNELLTNALKHAFPATEEMPAAKESEIEVQFHGRGNEYVMVVADNGIGLPAKLDYLDPVSLGLSLINILAGQLEGTIDLDRRGGTAFTVTFPKKGSPQYGEI